MAFAPPRADASTAQQWFEDTTTVDGDFRTLLEQYSHIDPDKVVSHVVGTRNRAWAVHPYPCLGQFRFLELNLAKRGLYKNLLASLKEEGSTKSKFLDIGCCLGQDVRKLIHDGAPSSTVVGAELNPAFLEIGYDLFKDQDCVTMLALNILDDPPLALKGTFTSVQLGMILHLFTWDEQVAAFRNTIQLLQAHTGVRIFGQATGNLDGTPTASVHGTRATFKHNGESFRRLVEQVSATTGTNWRVVTAELDNGLSIFDGKRTWDDPKTRRLVFDVERL
ncbi:methyltransferase domain-containing protein [Ophiostoma piceae UAMH 11346]|uniref:Methyltransferase domain-containing protein n=1 Tax=Ophiostoma piceae (strain UAMH 11346) TaxID=1262450 RepID=S3BUG6_OPHP1|nr:methyltransferase domain-containing protein [Ophiostoma piceae UAMH 11346]